MKSWNNYSTQWDKMVPPLRPAFPVVDFTHSIIPDGPRLLLGVTPEYHKIFEEVLALDSDQVMIDNIWPGDTDTKKAINQEWATFDTDQTFSGIVSDGALVLMGGIDNVKEFNHRSYRWLNSGGTVAHRVPHRPEQPVTREQLMSIMSRPASMNWNAFKWLMCMCVAEETQAVIQTSLVIDMFNELCSDRHSLSEITGWDIRSIDTIDLYKEMKDMLFPTKEEWLSTVPEDAVDVGMTYVYGYDLCELCPILSYRKHV